MYQGDERRGNYPTPEKEMYGIKDIDAFIENERRHDELDRLREVREQKKIWLLTYLVCLLVNIGLLALGVWGMLS